MNYFNTSSSRNILIIFCLIVSSIFIRLCLSGPIEQNGDVIFKWAMIRDFVENGVVPSQQVLKTHHALRWAVNIPVLFIQKAFGTEPYIYYVWPFFSSTIGVILTYLLVKKIHSKLWGIIAAVGFMFSYQMLRQGSQFLPMGPATIYILGSLYFFQTWVNSKRFSALIICTLFLFCSYGSKITSIYYFPAILLLIALYSNRSKKGGVFSHHRPLICIVMFLAILFGAEAILTQRITQVPGGRIVCLAKGKHGDSEKRIEKHSMSIAKKDWNISSSTLGEYLGNIFVYYKLYPDHAPKFGKILLYIALLFAIAILVLKKRELYVVSIPYLFGFFGHAYAVVTVYPFLRPEKMNYRYQTTISILAMLIIITFLGSLDKKQIYSAKDSKVKFFKRYYLQIALAFVFLSLYTIGTPRLFNNGYIQTKQNYLAVENARRQGKAVLITTQVFFPKRRRSYYHYLSLYSPTPSYYNKRKLKYYDFKLYRERKKQYLLVEKNSNDPFSFVSPHIILQQ